MLLLFISITSFAQILNYNIGDVVDDFTVTDTHGVEHNLYEYTAAGKYVYLDFFFVDCNPCRTTVPIYNEFYDKYGCNDGDLIMLSINNGDDDNAYVEWYDEEFGGTFNHAPAASNEGAAAAVDNNFNPQAYPTICMIGPDNTLLIGDIWPISGVQTFEATFATPGIDPTVMECSLGVTEIENLDFSIFPTVSNGQNINVTLANQVAKNISVYDVTGKLVYSNNENSNQITFNLNVNAGVYFVKVNTDTSSATKKIIIK